MSSVCRSIAKFGGAEDYPGHDPVLDDSRPIGLRFFLQYSITSCAQIQKLWGRRLVDISVPNFRGDLSTRPSAGSSSSTSGLWDTEATVSAASECDVVAMCTVNVSDTL